MESRKPPLMRALRSSAARSFLGGQGHDLISQVLKGRIGAEGVPQPESHPSLRPGRAAGHFLLLPGPDLPWV